jgi:hypothetical protein
MRSHPVKSRHLIYDCAWMVQPSIQLCHLLCPNIRRYNAEAVYGNILRDQGSRLFEPDIS